MSDVMSRRQPNTYFKAPGRKIGSRNIPAMHPDRLQSDGKAQAIAPFRAFIGRHLNKWLKDRLEEFFGHPGAEVTYRKKSSRFQCALIHFQRDLNIGPRWSEADSVADNILTGASQSMRIGVLQKHRVRCTQAYGFPQSLRFEVAVSRYFLHNLAEVYFISLGRRQPGFETREHQELAHQ